MNQTSAIEKTTETTAFAAWLGLDWGDQEHAFRLLAAGQAEPEAGRLKHSAEELHQWFQQLEQRFGGRPVAVGIESNRGGIFHVLAQYPWLEVFPINPVTSARYRQAFVPSGASDDGPDAGDLLELVHRHADRLRPLALEDVPTRKLAGLVQARRDTVDRRTQAINQLIILLKGYFPQSLGLVGPDLSAPLALDFLERWPELISLKRARPASLRNFYYGHNVRRPELVEQRVQSVGTMVALSTDEAVVAVAKRQLKLLVAVIRLYNRHIAGFEAEIASVFGAHPDKILFQNLPGAGKVLAPRLLVALGTDRTRYPEATSFQKYSGLAPVREKSGAQLWTHWRWRAPSFLRQSLVEWAGQTVVYCPWAGRYYQRMKAKGKKHHVILRALAFKWVRILWKCWQTHTPYDEARYLESLTRKRSPNLTLGTATT
jgi:hypothetical protein